MRQPTPHESATVDRLCATITHAESLELRSAIHRHLLELNNAARHNELLPTDLAEQLAASLDTLLATLPTLPEHAQRLVVGAARYFVSYEDVLPDLQGPLGLDDDVAVFNLAMHRIGRPDLEIAE